MWWFKPKTRNRTYKFSTLHLSLVLEPGWAEYKFDDENAHEAPLTFIKERGGVGALQISVATSKNNESASSIEQLKQEGKRFSEEKAYKLGEWEVYEYENTERGRYSKHFYLYKPHVIVYVTYNCRESDQENGELDEAVLITHSINVSPGS